MSDNKITYNFGSIDEFVAYLDTRAKELRRQQNLFHPRAHNNMRYGQGASELESIAVIVRSSNLVAIADFDKLAQAKGAVN